MPLESFLNAMLITRWLFFLGCVVRAPTDKDYNEVAIYSLVWCEKCTGSVRLAFFGLD